MLNAKTVGIAFFTCMIIAWLAVATTTKTLRTVRLLNMMRFYKMLGYTE